MAYPKYKYDIFISYAVEDKISIVTELVEKLERSGLKVWFAGQELRVGKSIQEVIKEGLNNSRYGVVILTHNYFTKDWPKKELHALWGKSDSFIIPIWHNMTTEEVKRYDPLLADKWGVESSKGIDVIIKEILKAIQENKQELSAIVDSKRTNLIQKTSFKTVLTFTSTGILALVALWFFLIRDLPPNSLVVSSIESRIEVMQSKIINDHELEMSKKNGVAATIQQVTDYHERYENIKAQYRNEYYFKTGYSEFNFKKNVEPALGVEIDHLAAYNNFGFTYPNIFAIDYLPSPHTMDVKTIFINTQQVKFEIMTEKKTEDERYLVEVKYENQIRYISVDLTYSKRSDWAKRREYTFQGLLPKETYRFAKEGGQWVFVGIN
ncbi:toll/interleukin-1 receptor domain-containing protein [Fulvivirga sp.]|uniref:toll/interleukin-1 receptor domain-containing protein n=1 Tax=Fulvivirga sp. TaxID=1931237 RepID=UPI0032F095D3